MTQVVRVGRVVKAEITDIRVRVMVHWEQSGSILGGTLVARCTQLESDLSIDSPEAPELIAAVIHNAKSSCYAEAAIRDSVPTVSHVFLNGAAFDYTRYPSKPPRVQR